MAALYTTQKPPRTAHPRRRSRSRRTLTVAVLSASSPTRARPARARPRPVEWRKPRRPPSRPPCILRSPHQHCSRAAPSASGRRVRQQRLPATTAPRATRDLDALRPATAVGAGVAATPPLKAAAPSQSHHRMALAQTQRHARAAPLALLEMIFPSIKKIKRKLPPSTRWRLSTTTKRRRSSTATRACCGCGSTARRRRRSVRRRRAPSLSSSR